MCDGAKDKSPYVRRHISAGPDIDEPAVMGAGLGMGNYTAPSISLRPTPIAELLAKKLAYHQNSAARIERILAMIAADPASAKAYDFSETLRSELNEALR